MSGYRIMVSLVNETEGRRFSDWDEPVEDWLLNDDGTPDTGHIYRVMQEEYGRCQSSIYVDKEGQAPKRVGWFFLSRQRYEDTDEPYLRGAWVTINEVVEPAQPMRMTEMGF